MRARAATPAWPPSSGNGCWRPPLKSEAWLQRFEWMDGLGDRWWPVLGSVYFVVAVKRVEAAGTYQVRWRATPRQGAQLWLAAVE